MKFVCINKVEGLIVGKQYEIPGVEYTYENISSLVVLITDDSNNLNWYSLDNFKPLENIREEKLKSLGI